MREIERDVVGELGMDDGRARRDGLELIAYHRQRLPIDGHQLGRVLRLGPAVGDDHRDGLALPDGAVRGQQPLRRGTMARPMQCDADERLAARVDVARDQHRGDARRLLCRFDVDRNDFCVRVRTAHKAGVQHPRQLDVVDVAAMAAEQPFQLPPRDARADAGGRGRAAAPSAPASRCHHRFDGVDDGVIAGATAHVAGHGFADIGARQSFSRSITARGRSAACRTSRTRIARRCAR